MGLPCCRTKPKEGDEGLGSPNLILPCCGGKRGGRADEGRGMEIFQFFTDVIFREFPRHGHMLKRTVLSAPSDRSPHSSEVVVVL